MSTTLKVLYEDNHIIAVFKPAGMLTQPTHKASAWQSKGDKSGDVSLYDLVKDYIRKKKGKPSLLEPGNARPAKPWRSGVFLGLVHRLDRPVAGIILFAKTSKGASRLSEQFRNHEVEKIYHAIVLGKPEKDRGVLVDYLEKDKNKLKAEKSLSGKEAVLYYEVVPMLEASRMLGGEAAGIKFGKCSLLKIKLETGKFHQIRAQLSVAGLPILGDVKYAGEKWGSGGEIALAATAISFKMATEDKIINLEIPLPLEWEKFV